MNSAFTLVLSSHKPEAKQFKRWITHEVLPFYEKIQSFSAPSFLFWKKHYKSRQFKSAPSASKMLFWGIGENAPTSKKSRCPYRDTACHNMLDPQMVFSKTTILQKCCSTVCRNFSFC